MRFASGDSKKLMLVSSIFILVKTLDGERLKEVHFLYWQNNAVCLILRPCIYCTR